MKNMANKYLCKKDFFMNDGKRSFTKGKRYKGTRYGLEINGQLCLIDDNNEIHIMGPYIEELLIFEG